MNLLAMLLPGIRDLRIPMSAGLLWLIVLVVAFASNISTFVLDTPQTAAIGRALTVFPESLVVVAAAAVAFLLGMIATAPSLSLMKVSGRLLQRAIARLDQDYHSAYFEKLLSKSVSLREYPRLARYLRESEKSTRPISAVAQAMTLDTIVNTFSRAKVPGGVAMLYPIKSVVDSLPHVAPHLAVTAPALFQDYDRYRSEAELRMAIVPPLLTLPFVAPIAAKPLVVALVTIGCIALLLQAVQQTRAANNVLANAAYLNHVSLPPLQAIVDTLGDLRKSPKSEGEWVGAMICAMDQRSMYEEADLYMDEVFDFGDHEMVPAAMKYLKDHNYSQFRVAVKKLQAQPFVKHLQLLKDTGLIESNE